MKFLSMFSGIEAASVAQRDCKKRIARRFDAAEDEIIRARSSIAAAAAIARDLGRSQASVISRQCSLGLRVPNRSVRRFSESEDRAIRETAGQSSLYDLAELLGRRPSSLYGRAKALGLDFSPALRPARRRLKGGYYWVPVIDSSGRRVWRQEHRHVMEIHLGRKLSSNAHVHHINFDKTNNDIENLYLCRNSSHHKTIHNSAQTALGSALAVSKLMLSGHLAFDREVGRYYFRGDL